MIKARPWLHLHLFSRRQLLPGSPAVLGEQRLPPCWGPAAGEPDLLALPAGKDSAAGKPVAVPAGKGSAGRPAAAARSGVPDPDISSGGHPAPAVTLHCRSSGKHLAAVRAGCLFSYCVFLLSPAVFLPS